MHATIGGSAAAYPSAVCRHLPQPVLELVLCLADPADLSAAHLVSRAWCDAARLATRRLAFRGALPDTARLKQAFPRLDNLTLERIELSPLQLLCVAGLSNLTALHLRVCRLEEGASVLALRALRQLQVLELQEVAGPSAAQLDDALRGCTALQHLRVETLSGLGRAPSLRSLATLRGMRRLAVKQAQAQPGPVGLTSLDALHELQDLELQGAGVTNSIVARVSTLSQLTRLRVPGAALVTDGGLQALAGLTGLQDLDLSCLRPQGDGPITDVGVAHLVGLDGLTRLSLAGRTPLTANGLAFLQGATRLEILDLSRVQLASGSAAFLWQLTRLSSLHLGGTHMPADQFNELSRLAQLAVLDASSTGFDDACCALLAPLRSLHAVKFSHTEVTSTGVRALAHTHCDLLTTLRLDGCRVSLLTLLHMLRRQQAGLCLWDERERGHLPRCINKANALLMTSGPDGSRRWRVRHAPEDSRLACLGAGAATAGLLLTHLVVLLATLLVLMLLPLAFSCTAVALAALAAVGRPVPQSTLFHAAVRGEMLLSALLVGVLAVHVPPPPYRSVWDF